MPRHSDQLSSCLLYTSTLLKASYININRYVSPNMAFISLNTKLKKKTLLPNLANENIMYFHFTFRNRIICNQYTSSSSYHGISILSHIQNMEMQCGYEYWESTEVRITYSNCINIHNPTKHTHTHTCLLYTSRCV